MRDYTGEGETEKREKEFVADLAARFAGHIFPVCKPVAALMVGGRFTPIWRFFLFSPEGVGYLFCFEHPYGNYIDHQAGRAALVIAGANATGNGRPHTTVLLLTNEGPFFLSAAARAAHHAAFYRRFGLVIGRKRPESTGIGTEFSGHAGTGGRCGGHQ